MTLNNVKLKTQKCSFFQTKICYLGHEISFNQIKPNVSNTLAVNKIDPPTNETKLRSFLGLANYYRRFVKNFSQIASPLYELLNKDKKFAWCDKCQSAFETLKKMLTSEPILTLYDQKRNCNLYTDACSEGIGAILVQPDSNGKESVIAYFSKRNNKAQRNYSATELECLAVVTAAKQFDHYLKPGFILYTDHKALEWLRGKKDLKGKLFRWAWELSTKSFTVKYREGRKMTHVDALSRLAVVWHMMSNEIKEAQLNIDLPPKVDFEKVDGIVCLRKDKTRAFIPESLRKKLLQQYHDDFSHPGARKTMILMNEFFFWPKMAKEIEEYVQTCVPCQLTKESHQPTLGKSGLPPIPSQPVEIVGLDTLDLTHESKACSKKKLQIAICHFSKMVWARPTKTNTANDVLLLLEDMVKDGYTPKRLLTDNAKNFHSKTVKEFVNRHGIDHRFSTSYHPQTNGQIERYNHTVLTKLRVAKFVRPKVKWTTLLDKIIHDYNRTPHSATGFTPIYLLEGERPENSDRISNRTLEENRKIAKENLRLHTTRRKEKFDKNHKEHELQVGDLVARKLANNNPNRTKLGVRYEGPFRIEKIIHNYAVEIQSIEFEDTQPIRAHVSQLKKFKKRTQYV
jgi:hypothetical protein